MSLRKAGVTGLSYEGRGERIARGFYIPVLKESIAYDRATGYARASQGLKELANPLMMTWWLFQTLSF